MATLVDSNVLLDVLTQDRVWGGWSSTALARAADAGSLVINPVVYAEVSTRFERIEDLERSLPASDFRRDAIPWEAAFLAAKAFAAYRRRGGIRTSTLPDFFIGAHAAVAGHTLLTRDVARYRTSYPALVLVSPPAPGGD
ncbi:type II toxin-antitoxin system VapC family toxin [Dermatophilaceae bacterium Soc4.6]